MKIFDLLGQSLSPSEKKEGFFLEREREKERLGFLERESWGFFLGERDPR